MTTTDAGRVLAFWFEDLEDADWWKKNDLLDARIRDDFGGLLKQATAGGLDTWVAAPDSCLALVIVLDQFSRNIHRGTLAMFAADAKALGIARIAVDRGFDRAVAAERRVFFYLPFEHSENLADQETCCRLVADLGPGQYLDYALAHKRVIERFGRFPHRNAILNRPSTAEEEAFLKEPGSSF